jgi:DNA-binding transcriptional LysR family regulator
VPATIHRRILLREGWKVLLRSDHPAGSALGVEEYCRLPHAVQIVGAARQQSTVDIELARHGAKRDIALVASTSVPAVMAGRDFAVTVPDSVALLRAMARGLRVADPPVKIPAFELMMAWHRKRETDTLHRMLRGFVARACELL